MYGHMLLWLWIVEMHYELMDIFMAHDKKHGEIVNVSFHTIQKKWEARETWM
jgi:hypothetical protein